MGSLRVEGAVKRFGAVQVLNSIDLEVADGEFVVLVGPSGCGKSTLLRLIAGLEEMSEGKISISARVVNDLPPKERNIAMVFQNYALYPHMQVADNMAFSLKLARRPRAEIDELVGRAAGILDLQRYLKRLPRELSGGQRQRVAMGRAIVRNPEVFLFDEPLSNLDAQLRVAMRAEIRALHQRLATTTVYVTHDQIEAMTMADRIVVMRDGNVEQIGTPLDLYDGPTNTFVASFIGSPSMNLLSGRIGGAADAPVFDAAGGGGTWPLPVGLRLAPGREVIYGVRPEGLRLDPSGTPATVSVVEPTGAETHVVLEFAGRTLVMVVHDRLAVKPGEVVKVLPDRLKAHVFDAETLARIVPSRVM